MSWMLALLIIVVVVETPAETGHRRPPAIGGNRVR